MIKLYNHDIQGRLCYHEAWTTDANIVEHWGQVGTVGQTVHHPYRRNGDETAALERILGGAREQGFCEISDEDHRTLVLEYQLDSDDTNAKATKQNNVIGLLDEILGWTGLGRTEGSDADQRKISIYCLVVEFELARQIISEDLSETQHDDYLRIYDEETEFSRIPQAQS